mmetsp:Transcript_24713/g.53930  ORF Transcript_24713/g.53930 Transcript_24713/m.53930 type:complete len:244 (+) Transcript_24713:321-1052(+)
MCTWLPAFCRKSLMVAPPGPMRPPTSSAGTAISRGAPGSPPGAGNAGRPGGAMPAVAGVPAGRASIAPGMPGGGAGTPGGRTPGGKGNPGKAGGGPGGGRGIPPIGQPLMARVSVIIFSHTSRLSPTIMAWPCVSLGAISILTSVPLLWRISWMVSPPLPMSVRIWRASNLIGLNLEGSTPGGALGSAFGMRSCSQSGTPAFPSWSHLLLRRVSLSSAAEVGGGALPSGGIGVWHWMQFALDL